MVYGDFSFILSGHHLGNSLNEFEHIFWLQSNNDKGRTAMAWVHVFYKGESSIRL